MFLALVSFVGRQKIFELLCLRTAACPVVWAPLVAIPQAHAVRTRRKPVLGVNDNGQSVSDRRKWHRVTFDSRVRIIIHREQEASTVNGQLSDLSEGGAAIFVPSELKTGDAIEVQMKLPYSSSPVHVKALVRSRSSFRYGVEFVDLTVPVRRVLTRACSVLKLVD